MGNRQNIADLLYNCICCSLHGDTMFIEKAAYGQADFIRKIPENH